MNLNFLMTILMTKQTLPLCLSTRNVAFSARQAAGLASLCCVVAARLADQRSGATAREIVKSTGSCRTFSGVKRSDNRKYRTVQLDLTSRYGIGHTKASLICAQCGISDEYPVDLLTRHQLESINQIIATYYKQNLNYEELFKMILNVLFQ